MSRRLRRTDDIGAYFDSLATEKGDSHLAVGWPSAENQRIRFDAALRLIEPEAGAFTVNDFGCGLAHLYDHIRERGLPMLGYCGFDLSESSLRMARERLGGEPELIRSDRVTRDADYSFACGIFNSRFDGSDQEWMHFMKSVAVNLHEHSTRGFAFSSLSTHADWMEPQLFYADPVEFFDFCRREISPHVAILHDYPIHEWTMLVRCTA